jgi:predicted ATPase/class 3 adenylate cyclase
MVLARRDILRRVASLPTGTVTFLFTDVAGSTRQWELDPGAMSERLALHDEVMRAAIEAHSGHVFATGGDGFAAAFADPRAAVRAAVEAQASVGLPVRMGVHTGTAEERHGNYFGRTLNRGARIMAAGQGGQILLSETTAALVRDELLLVDLGEHQFADVGSPIRVWQVGDGVFAALRSLSAAAGNLPVLLDSFVGRAVELTRLLELMATSRLVTVVGVGGMGKTRLVIEAGHHVRAGVIDGIWFVELGLARSEHAVAEQVASSLRLRPAQGQSVEDRLIEHLADRAAVLVVDNCEHVMRAAAGLVERLLRASCGLRVVATSREALMVPGEQVMPLGPLSVGEAGADGDAVALFVDRVRAGRGSFNPDPDEHAAAGEICRRLDGMPLAIELAAARTGSLGVAGVLDLLGERLRLLSGGSRTRVERHQTLQATLDWSYALLTDQERTVFDRLAVFVGWFTLADAIAVAGGGELLELDVIDAVSGLVDKSMCAVDPTSHPARYRYLETMRAYARDHLSRTGALLACRTRHAVHIAHVATALAEALVTPREVEAAAEVERRAADVRAALVWAADQGLDEVLDGIVGLSGPMLWRGSYDVNRWCYELRDDVPAHARIQVAAMGHALVGRGDLPETGRMAHRILDAREFQGNAEAASLASTGLGWVAFFDGDVDTAIRCQERYCAHMERSARPSDRAFAAWPLAVTLAISGRDAGELPQQIIDRATALGWRSGVAFGYYAEAVATEASNPVHSLDAYNRAFAIAIDVGNRNIEALARRDRISLQWNLLTPAELGQELIDLLRHLQAMGDAIDTVNTLSRAVELLHAAGRSSTAASIFGWLDGRSGRTIDSFHQLVSVMAGVETAVGDRWSQLLDRGLAMTADQVIDLTCSELAAIS